MNCLTKILILLSFSSLCINVHAQLSADFTASSVEGCSPLTVQFKDISTGNPTDWEWDLGNGVTSTEKDASTVYITPGAYTVKLKIKNAAGEDAVTKTNFITIHEKPATNFTANPLEGCVPLDVSFTDLSLPGSGSINTWLWDFGDGNTSTEQKPVHQYTIVDSFNVTLEVANSFGCKKVLNKPSYIKLNSLVKASFTYNYNSACAAPVTITFNNTSQSNKPTTYQWDFGDGSALNTEKNPVHTYLATGSFTVKLIATNADGCLNTYTQTISVGTSKPNFTFSGSCVNTPVVFTDSSSPTPLTELWNFGDGTTGSGPIVTHIYPNTGSYTVSLNADFGGCKGSVQKIITITDKIVAGFDAANRITCQYPVAIQFENKSKNAKNYKWILSNGSTSEEADPVFTYYKPGNFSVTLIAFNEDGCADTVIKNDFIQIGAPQIDGIENLPFEGCAPQTLTLRPITASDTVSTFYYWDFGDGTTSTSAIPTHTYSAGVYDVTLIAKKSEGCADTLFIPQAVKLGTKPKASFSANPTNTCASTPVQFTDASTGNITDWFWDFGDSVYSTEKNPLHYYKDTGYFDVTLSVGQYKCYDKITFNGYIYITPPVSKFHFSSQCNTPYTYEFNENAIGATSWLWNFGDGNTSANPTVSHTYNSKGVYVVSLTVSNGICDDVSYDTVRIVEENPSIQYEFLSKNSCQYDSVRFFIRNYNAANILAYQWDFGDGSITNLNAADSVVYHSYDSAGNYKPVLILKNINSCLDTVKSNVQVKVSGPTAAFNNKSGDCLSSTIVFKDASSAETGSNITTWIWNYGDSSRTDTLTAGPFSHTYSSTGAFDVLLKIIDNNNCYDTATFKGLQITKPLAIFTVSDSVSCVLSAVQFINSSQGSSLTYNWNFGDGNSSNAPSPLHQYAYDTVYSVKLTVKDINGCVDSLFKPNYITVDDPVADFTLNDSVFACPPAKLIPITNVSAGYKNVLWDFGDGNTSEEIMPQHYYTLTGDFIVKLIVYGFGTCSDTMSKSITVKGPSAVLNYSPFAGCDTVPVAFSVKGKNVVRYTWDFGNGITKTGIDSFAKYTYAAKGKYLPKLVIEDLNGCQVPIINNDTITVSGAEAMFTAIRVPGTCDSTLFDFIDSSKILFDTISGYKWLFGDGDSATGQNPKHYYDKAGLYNTDLNITTKNGCQSTYNLPVNVTVDAAPEVFASIPDTVCANADVSLTAGINNDSPDNYNWFWNFGDGNSLTTPNGNYAYSNAGSYNVSVTATTAAGCAGTFQQKLIVKPSPQTEAGADVVICREQSTNLQASGADIYLWTSDAALTCFNCSNTTATPLYNTTFYVTGSNTAGCSTTDSVTVLVKQPANVLIDAPDTICIGTTIQLKASGAELYAWSPANIVSNSTDSVITSTPSSSVTYSVTGTDNKGCFSDTASILVNVFPIPSIQLKDSVIDINAGNNYQLNASGSPDVTEWLWKPAIDISCTNCANPVIHPKQTTIYTVTASNAAGCSTEKSITVRVFCNKEQNLFIPNTFSPNSDGMNDYFYPRGKGLMTIKSMRIFNRLGAVVYQQSNFPANQQSYGWDGTFKNKALQPDVYVYIVEISCENGQTLSSKGNVTLLR